MKRIFNLGEGSADIAGISSDLYRQLRTVLLACGPFSTDDELNTIFVEKRLSPWRNRLPQTDNATRRVEKVIYFLYDQHNDEGKNALVLMLRVLSERHDTGDDCHHRLAKLANELEHVVKSLRSERIGPESRIPKLPPRRWIWGVVAVVALVFVSLGVFLWNSLSPTDGGQAPTEVGTVTGEVPGITEQIPPSAAVEASEVPVTDESIGTTPTISLPAIPTSPKVTPPPPVTDTGQHWRRVVDNMEMVSVPGSTFMMGNSACPNVPSGQIDECPPHPVRLDSFWIDRTEVTNAQFADFVDKTGHVTTAERDGNGYIYNGSDWDPVEGANWQHPQGPGSDLTGKENHPVVQVAWEDAQAYCTWVGGRLPTEAEWEEAAGWNPVAGNLRTFPWGDDLPDDERLNFNDDLGSPRDVGRYAVGNSFYGAADMAGNVWEWVADWYDENYYLDSPQDFPAGNPTGPGTGDRKVVRGGGWFTQSNGVHVTNRQFFRIVVTHNDQTGFRCVVPVGS